MNKEKIVKICNIIALISIILLIYWVFIFINITVFGFKVFKENITQSFYLSILGILSLLIGTLIINIMLNLTRIADYISNKNNEIKKTINKKFIGIFIVTFPIIFSLLFLGDIMTANKKKQFIINAGNNIRANYKDEISQLMNYEFDKKYISAATEILGYLSKSDESIKRIQLIINDNYNDDSVYLIFGNNYFTNDDKNINDINKVDYIFKCSSDEKKYLREIFNDKKVNIRFSKYDGKYELYYPIEYNNKIIILYFTDYQEYGKFGS
ncbi:MAG TPA: hypothetical protein PLG34_01015 [Spirochaetota bacterium]|nr:MAG: hypothetical protein BWX91_00723 [Spirochaetes bacterium ADurb.Bin133]HNZ26060.1 hypothetical protein [Spirochaetota bacterium]HPY86549.1 hypothetical protein [Spirochaetota bacterium]